MHLKLNYCNGIRVVLKLASPSPFKVKKTKEITWVRIISKQIRIFMAISTVLCRNYYMMKMEAPWPVDARCTDSNARHIKLQ
jgi:hypothetical protein